MCCRINSLNTARKEIIFQVRDVLKISNVLLLLKDMLRVLTTSSPAKTFCSRYKANKTVRKSELETGLISLQNKCHRI
jgi:hypothetical protein